MTDEQNKPVRSRDEQAKDVARQLAWPRTLDDGDILTAEDILEEAEARGAAEQRRKYEERECCTYERIVGGEWVECSEDEYHQASGSNRRFSYFPWAHAAALGNRVRELEEENARLKNNPLENDVTCALMDSQYVAGAKFGWNCSQDEDHESLAKMIEGRLRDRIEAGVSFSKRSQDARAALMRTGTPS